MLGWTRSILDFRESIDPVEDWDPAAIDEQVRRFDFLGDRFLFSLHFGLAALAGRELAGDAHRRVYEHLEQSVRKIPGRLPNSRQWHQLHLIAMGLVAEPRSLNWLRHHDPPPDDETVVQLIRLVLPSRSEPILRGFASWAEARERPDWIDLILRSQCRNDPAGLCLDLMEKHPPDDARIGQVIEWGLARSHPAEARKWADRISDDSIRNRVISSLPGWNREATGPENHRAAPPPREWENHEFRLDEFENEKRDEYQKSEGVLDYFEREEIMGELCEAWAARKEYGKLIGNLDKLSRKGCLGEVVDTLSRSWNPEEDLPVILSLCLPSPGDDDDRDDYMTGEFLHLLVYELAEAEQNELAGRVAEHLVEHFEEEEGRECLATWYFWRGDYGAATRLGGARPSRYWCPPGYEREFLPGGDDDLEAIRSIQAIRDWTKSPESLLRYAWHGNPRTALAHLLTLEVRHRVADWVFNPYYEGRPDYPRDLGKLLTLAREKAHSEIRLNEGGQLRTPIEFRLLRAALLGTVGIINLLVYRRWSGKEGKEDRSGRDEARAATCRRKVAEGLDDAGRCEDRKARIRMLSRLPDELRFVDRKHCDRYVDATELIAALEAELAWVGSMAPELDPRDRTDLLETLGKALAECGCVRGAADAWTEYSRWEEVPSGAGRELVRRTGAEHWHLVAPMASTDPMNSALLAAKLEIWFREVRRPPR